MQAAIGAVDWSAPWLARHRRVGERVALRVSQAGAAVADALNAELTVLDPAQRPHLAAGPLRFVAQAAQPPGTAYEAFIAAHAQVPTRENLHDLFNGLAWLHWPCLKRRLNELQAAEIAAHGVGATRGAVRDALTLFDENAALLRLPPRLEEALRARDWTALFVARRADWSGARIDLFGHALMEKLCAPRKAITAHAWLLPERLADDEVDGWLASALDAARLADRHPVPVLGIPGWCDANHDPAFYADAAVFRPPLLAVHARPAARGRA